MKRKLSFKTQRPQLKRQKTTLLFPPVVQQQNLRFQSNTVSKQAEKKNTDLTLTITSGLQLTLGLAVATFTAGGLNLLNGIAQGVAETQRVGRKVQMKKLSIRYVYTAQTTSVAGGVCRIIVVYDKQANGAVPAIGDILGFNEFESLNNLNNSDRFITLADVTTDPISANNNFAVAGEIHRKMQLETMFTGAGGAIANIVTGSIILIAAQSGGIATAAPLLSLCTRIRFVDI